MLAPYPYTHELTPKQTYIFIIGKEENLVNTDRRLTMEDKERRSKEYLTEAEAAEFLGVAARTLRDWRRKGRVDGKGTKPQRAYVRGRHIYYAEDELDSWIREGSTDVDDADVRMRKKKR